MAARRGAVSVTERQGRVCARAARRYGARRRGGTGTRDADRHRAWLWWIRTESGARGGLSANRETRPAHGNG